MARLLCLTLIAVALLFASPLALAAEPTAVAAPAPAGDPASVDGGGELLDADPESLPTPPGLREDQALWAAALESSFLLVSVRGTGRSLLWQAVAGRFDEVLAVREKGDTEEAERATALRHRLSAAYAGVYRTVTTHWGVDPRLGCRSEAVSLDGSMRTAGNAETPDLREARSLAGQCIFKARRGAAENRKTNQVLQAVLAEAEHFLAAPAGAPVPPATAPMVN